MGLDAVLEDESGQRLGTVGDPGSLLVKLLTANPDSSSVCLRFIDPYQVTTFNQRQMGSLIGEIESVAARAATDDEKRILEAVVDLARRCAAEPHLYVRFYGD